MGMPEEGETSKIRQRFKDLCLDLNMDQETEEDAWEAFEGISHSYTLEGDSLHWLACSLYVSCRKSTVPTVSGQDDVEGNCVSLTRLLRSTKLSLIDFFKKMKKWADMASLPQRFRDKVERLERNFAVSTVTFGKFEPIFRDIFVTPSLPLSPGYSSSSDAPPKVVKGRKQKRTTLSVNEVFCFCWTTFVQVKGNFSTISDDLVNSYHLLLCCIDWTFANVILTNKRDLLNPNFEGLPKNFRLREYKPPTDPPCIIAQLCEKHEGIPKEAKGIKEHFWKPYIRKQFEKKILVGQIETLSKVLDLENFDKNSKSLNNAYEEFVLNIGDFDERIFLGEDSAAELGTPAASLVDHNFGNFADKFKSRTATFDGLYEGNPLKQATPLTNRRYLSDKGDIFSPVSTATHSVSGLQTLLSARKTGPSDELVKMFSNCPKNPGAAIAKRISEMGAIFCSKYPQSSTEMAEGNNEAVVSFAKRRLQLAESLYYLELENIVISELKNPVIPSESKASVAATIFQQDELHRSLFAVCLEIVIFSYNFQKVFPWIIEVLEIPAFSFYKVIEIVNRNEKGLSRDVVKHLNRVEEMILESLVWKSDSVFWDVLKKYGSVPTVEEVLLPSQFSQESNTAVVSSATTTTNNNNNGWAAAPLTQQPLQTNFITSNSSLMLINPPGHASPVSRPIHETFISPVPVKRRLFDTTSTTVATPAATTVTTNAPGEHPHPVRTIVVSKQITVQLSPSKRKNEEKIENIPTVPPSKLPNKPKKTGSMPIFFRKVYYLASVRLRDLCEKLGLDPLLCSQIWTCLEQVFVSYVDILKDRHLDQIVMCCVYVICKVTERDCSFQDIMRCYRLQPQAESHVYRSVLLESRPGVLTNSNESGNNTRTAKPSATTDDRKLRKDKESELNMVRSSSTLPSSRPPTPTKVAGTSLSFKFEERGDLIKFYNSIFISLMKNFALKFRTNKDGKSHSVILSPLPAIRGQTISPRRVSSNVYVSPINSPKGGSISKVANQTNTPTGCFLYCFNRSPSRDLHAINNLIKNSMNASNMNNSENVNKRPANQMDSTRNFKRRLHQVVTERHAANGST